MWIFKNHFTLRIPRYIFKVLSFNAFLFGIMLHNWKNETQQKAQEQTTHIWKLEMWQIGHFKSVRKEKPIQHGDETAVYLYDK